MATFALVANCETGEEQLIVPILRIGKIVSYTIPSFSVITVKLREIKYQCQLPDKSLHTVDGFIREDQSLQRSYPAEVLVKKGSENACMVDVSG